MQNVSIPVPRPDDLFDAEPANSLSLPKLPASGHRPDGSLRFPIDAKRAVFLSLLVHALLAVVLCVRSSQTLPPAMNDPLQATWITWAESPLPVVNQHKAAASPGVRHHLQPTDAAKHPAVTHRGVPPGIDAGKDAFPDARQAGVTLNTAEAILPVPQSMSSSDKSTSATSAQTPPAASAQPPAHYATSARPRYRDNAATVYPPEARLRGQQGVVVVHVEVLPEGRTGMVNVKSSSGYLSLDQAALEAVRGWTFEPATQMGKPVAARVDIPIRFVLKKNE